MNTSINQINITYNLKGMKAAVTYLLLSLTACDVIEDVGNSADDPLAATLTQSITRWTQNVELFAEFPPFVVGEESKFAIHFTDLKDYKPISEAIVTASLIGTEQLSHSVDESIRPGIFTPVLKPAKAGTYRLLFKIEFDGNVEQIEGGEVNVHLTHEEARTNFTEPEEGDITFLKEQAWRTSFSVTRVKSQRVKERISVAGEIVNNPSLKTTVASTAAGMVVFAKEILPGKYLQKDEKIGVIVGKDIVAGVAAEENLQHVFLNSKAIFLQAKINYERQQQLHKENVISALDFEQYQLTLDLAKAEYQTVANNYVEEVGGIELKASTSGVINDVWTGPGDYVEVGAPILSIVPNERRLLRLDVPISYYSQNHLIELLRWKQAGEWFEDSPEVVAFSPKVESGDAFYSILLKAQPLISLPGEYLEAELVLTSSNRKNMAIPADALLEDYGIYSVIVQVTGESFQKREIKIGTRNTEFIEVLVGLEEGEVIVVKGAYQVKMASMAGEAPAHGHER